MKPLQRRKIHRKSQKRTLIHTICSVRLVQIIQILLWSLDIVIYILTTTRGPRTQKADRTWDGPRFCYEKKTCQKNGHQHVSASSLHFGTKVLPPASLANGWESPRTPSSVRSTDWAYRNGGHPSARNPGPPKSSALRHFAPACAVGRKGSPAKRISVFAGTR